MLGIWIVRLVLVFVMYNSFFVNWKFWIIWNDKVFKVFNFIKIIENCMYVLSEYVFISINVIVFDKYRFYSICLWYILFLL